MGRRISVRRVVGRNAAGRLQQGDVVGDLVGLDAQTAVVSARGGLVEVPLDAITLARLAPPSTADELALEAVMARGLRPADTEQVGGWTLRWDHGFTHRANSALPLRQLGLPLDDVVRTAHEWYARRDAPLVVQAPVEARRLLDAELGERGWAPSLETSVLVARLDGLAAAEQPGRDGGPPGSPGVSLASAPDDAWLACYRGGAGLEPRARELLVRHDRVAFAAVKRGARTVAVARGTVDDRWLGVMAVEVEPDARRQGLGSEVMAALWAWGREQGAERSYLAVAADNAAAVALYEKLGYWHHHDYRYRTEP